MKRSAIKAGVALICVFAMSFCSVGAFAADQQEPYDENVQEVVLDEIEYIDALQATPEEELAESGYTQEEIEEISQIDVRELLCERAQLSDQELAIMGYTEEQLDVFEELRVNPDDPTIDIAVLSATCNGNVYVDNYSSTSSTYTIRYNWNWTTIPLTGLTDSVALRWLGVDSSGHYIDLISSSKSAKVQYYYINTGTAAGSPQTYSATTDTNHNTIKASFAQEKAISDMANDAWAKSGNLYVTLRKGGTENINYICASAVYGHMIISCSASLSYAGDWSVSFTPIAKVQNSGKRNVRIEGYSVKDIDEE